MGPHPFPMIVRDFQRVIGDETQEQILRGKPFTRCSCCLYWWW